jgi:outer membrane protein assembly factor BamB
MLALLVAVWLSSDVRAGAAPQLRPTLPGDLAGQTSQPQTNPAPFPAPRPGDPKKKPDKPEALKLFPVAVAWRQPLTAPPGLAPAYDAATAYIPLKTGGLIAVAIRDGVTRWTLEKAPVILPPVVDSGRLYLVADGTLDARNVTDGQPIWRAATKGTVSAPLVARAGWVILALDNGDVMALKGDTGEHVWQLELGATVRTEPLIVGDRLYLAPEGSGLLAVDLVSGKKVWERDLGATVNSIAAHAGVVCAGTTGRMLYGVDEKRGEVKWKWRIGGDVIGRPAFDDETAYVVSMDNTIRAFALRDGAQRWREALAFRPLSGPIRVEGSLLIASFSPAIRGYLTKDGKRDGAFNLPISERSAPAAPPAFVKRASFIDDEIVMTTLDGEIIAMRRVTMGAIMPITNYGTPVPAPIPPGPVPPPSATAALPHD